MNRRQRDRFNGSNYVAEVEGWCYGGERLSVLCAEEGSMAATLTPEQARELMGAIGRALLQGPPVPPRECHGLVCTDANCDYSDLTEYGVVTIKFEGHTCWVNTDGFEFEHASSCREVFLKAASWARDVLTQQIEAAKLVPGGHISGGVD